MKEGGRTLPHNLEAEASILGAILLNPQEALTRVIDQVTLEDFYSPSHQEIYRAMHQLYEQGQAIDVITLEEQLRMNNTLTRIGGVSTLADLAGSVPTVENVGFYAQIVREKAILRGLIRTTTSIASEAYADQGEVQDFLDKAEKQIFELTQRTTTSNYRAVKQILTETFRTIEKRYGKKEAITGVPTGFIDFDKKTAGLQPSDLIILAARPSVGKTSFCLNIAQNTAMNHRVPVLFFSLEMSSNSLAERLLSAEAHIDSSKLRSGFFDHNEWMGLTRAASRIAEAPIFIDDSAAPTVLEIRAKARRFRADRTIFSEPDQMGLVIIDYLQLVRSHRNLNSREQEVAEVSRGLKALAKEIKLPVMALSQLRRAVEDRKDQKPQLSDLRESGAIEQDADVIAFIHRDEKLRERGAAELIIGKQRNGPVGIIELVFLDKYTRFENATRQDREDEL